MNFYELEAYVALAKNLHFGITASQLNMSPSALSRIINRLEEENKTIFLDRNNRQVVLTEQGKIFLKYAKEILDKQRELTEKLSGKSDELEGKLPVYASVTACYAVLPEFIKRITQEFPLIQLSVETGDPAAAINAVKENRAMLAVAAIPESGVANMETISVLKTPLIFAAPKSGPYTNLQGSPQDILSTVPLVLPKAGIARSRFDKWVKSRNVTPNIAAETEGNEAILAIAELGLGIGLVPKIVLEKGPYSDKFEVQGTGNILGYYDVGFIHKKEYSGINSAKRLFEAMCQVLKSF